MPFFGDGPRFFAHMVCELKGCVSFVKYSFVSLLDFWVLGNPNSRRKQKNAPIVKVSTGAQRTRLLLLLNGVGHLGFCAENMCICAVAL